LLELGCRLRVGVTDLDDRLLGPWRAHAHEAVDEHVECGLGGEAPGYILELAGEEQIVAVEEAQYVALGGGDTGVAGGVAAAVFL